MRCCFRPVALDEQDSAGTTAGLQKATSANIPPDAQPSKQPPSSGGHTQNPQGQPHQKHVAQAAVDPLTRLGEGNALQGGGQSTRASIPDPTSSQQSAHGIGMQPQQQQLFAADDSTQAAQNGVLQLVALLQELLALSTSRPKQPLSKAMGLLVMRLPVDWACLHVFSTSGRVVMQVGSALSPEAQRQRGASGSYSHTTPAGSTATRQRLSFTNVTSSSSGNAIGVGGPVSNSAGVQEVGAGHLAFLPGSGSSLELVSAGRQALAMYAANELEAAALPPDWQRLYGDRDLRSFLVVPIIASGSAGSIIGALSFGLTTITDWSLAWWMSSIQLLCGWAAGALPQNRANARAAFFDALWSATDLEDLCHIFVQHLPSAMADQDQHRLEVRLALVSSRLASCAMFAGPPDGRTSGEQQQPLHSTNVHQQQHQAPHAPPGQHTQQQPAPAAADAQLMGASEGRAASQRPGQHPGVTCRSAQGSDGNAAQAPANFTSSSNSAGASGRHSSRGVEQLSCQQQQPLTADVRQPVCRFTLPTANSVLLSALEWGEVMVVKDTVTYFGRNAAGGSSAVQDLFLPDRSMARGTLVLLPLVYRCRTLGCVYLLAPWDIHAEVGKAALQEMGGLLASGTFKAMFRSGQVQQQWYSQVLSEGPMPTLPEGDGSSSSLPVLPGQAAAAAQAVVTPNAQAAASVQVPAADALSAAVGASTQDSPSFPGKDALGSLEPCTISAGGCDSEERSAVSASDTGSEPGACTSNACSTSSNVVGTCPVPLSSREAIEAAAAAASSAAATAAAIAPVGAPISGHAAAGFTDLVLWPELLDVKKDLARSRYTAVYTAEYKQQLLAVKLFRYSSTLDPGGGAHASQLYVPASGGALQTHCTSSSSGGNVTSEADLEAVLSLQYRLCNMSHTHLLQHVAVYPRVYEVIHRRSSREPPDVYLAATMPRKERHHRCAVLVTEYASGGCLRDAVNRGQVHIPTAEALQAAGQALGWQGACDVACLDCNQLQLLVDKVMQQTPLAVQPAAARSSHEHSGPLPWASAPPARAQQPSAATTGASAYAPLLPPGQPPQDLQQWREPCVPLLRQLLLQVALGMQHLHAHGIIHGELRLDNVMISGNLPSAVALVLHHRHQRATVGGKAAAAAGPGDVQVVGGVPGGSLPHLSVETCREQGPVGDSSSGSRLCGEVPSPAASGAGAADSPAGNFVLKLKDIGLCTAGWSNRQFILRKLAGRSRLQAVSWLAPECFKGEGLSKFSDVYAFGILMWELYTGQVAFNDLVTSNDKVLQTVIVDGVRPHFPDTTPAWYIDLANWCWAGPAKSRPSFRRIVQALQVDDDGTAVAVPL